MFTGILLLCVIGTKDCTVSVFPSNFNRYDACYATLSAVKQDTNETKGVPFVVEDIRCISWKDKDV